MPEPRTAREMFDRVMGQIKDAQHGAAERWLEPHATHEVVRVSIGAEPGTLFFHCLTCATAVTVAFRFVARDGRILAEIKSDETTTLNPEQVENIRRMAAIAAGFTTQSPTPEVTPDPHS